MNITNIIAMIPARSGSKRCPKKNTRPFCDGPSLMELTIALAIDSGLFDRVIVSSENIRTLMLAEKCGASTLHRPPLLASDDADTESVMKHTIEMFPEYREMCVLYCQAGAFITPKMLRESCRRFNKKVPLISWNAATDKDAAQFYWVNTKRFIEEWEAGKELRDDQGAEHWLMVDSDIQDINTDGDWKLAEMKYKRMHKI